MKKFYFAATAVFSLLLSGCNWMFTDEELIKLAKQYNSADWSGEALAVVADRALDLKTPKGYARAVEFYQKSGSYYCSNNYPKDCENVHKKGLAAIDELLKTDSRERHKDLLFNFYKTFKDKDLGRDLLMRLYEKALSTNQFDKAIYIARREINAFDPEVADELVLKAERAQEEWIKRGISAAKKQADEIFKNFPKTKDPKYFPRVDVCITIHDGEKECVNKMLKLLFVAHPKDIQADAAYRFTESEYGRKGLERACYSGHKELCQPASDAYRYRTTSLQPCLSCSAKIARDHNLPTAAAYAKDVCTMEKSAPDCLFALQHKLDAPQEAYELVCKKYGKFCAGLADVYMKEYKYAPQVVYLNDSLAALKHGCSRGDQAACKLIGKFSAKRTEHLRRCKQFFDSKPFTLDGGRIPGPYDIYELTLYAKRYQRIRKIIVNDGYCRAGDENFQARDIFMKDSYLHPGLLEYSFTIYCQPRSVMVVVDCGKYTINLR